MDEKRLVDGATALAEKQSRVIKIEPAERPQNVRLRVAAYTRVSSDSEDQLQVRSPPFSQYKHYHNCIRIATER